MTADSAELKRSRQDLAAARLLIDHGFAPQAVSCAYYAGFYAVAAALHKVGQAQSTRDDLIASVVNVLVGEHGLDPQAGRLLRSLVERRRHADVEPAGVSIDEARRAVGYATYVVEAVAKWLKSPAKA